MTYPEDYTVIQPVWPAFDADEAVPVMARFGFPQATVLSQSIRMMSCAVTVLTPHGPFFLKRYHRSVMSVPELRARHQAVNLLRDVEDEHALTVTGFQLTPAGDSVVEEGEWLYELNDFAPGEDRYRGRYSWNAPDSLGEAESLGRALAVLHLRAEATASLAPADPGPGFFQARCDLAMGQVSVEDYLADRPMLTEWAASYAIQEGDAPRTVDSAPGARTNKEGHGGGHSGAKSSAADSTGTLNCADEAGHAAAHRLSLAAEVEAALAWRTPDITRAYASLPRLWIHGDGHCSNMMYEGDAVCAVFDFGLSAVSTAVADLAIALERNTLLWLDILDGNADAYRMDMSEAILRGYQTLRPLSAVEAALLPHIMRAVHVDPALDWIPYHLISGRPSNAQWALETFLRGHTAWFTTEAGRRYLDELAATIQATRPVQATLPPS
ncbi:phosphotransferase enzyme family protein [Schaalia sp. Marseille-Q2122]|uniref:phosphotransferase enzyme family protein n=1 Tax=Schaalia sp. Marseille-Q2122 TaxID=2736604 RepID=UPI00158E7049|nr:phosphotransferase [Schaalia sp. Marseille-Q2122]